MLAQACSGPLVDVVKTVEAAEAKKESALLLECVPASVLVVVLLMLTLSVRVSPSLLLLTRS